MGSSCWIETSEVVSSIEVAGPTRLPSFTCSSPIRPSIGENIRQ